jgi:hypothetical protein
MGNTLSLLRLLMSDTRPDLPDIFPRTINSAVSVHDWATKLTRLGDAINCCGVMEVKYYKCLGGRKEHEFLVFHVRYQPMGGVTHDNYLVAERGPDSPIESDGSLPDDVVQGSKIVSSRPVPAKDAILISKDGLEQTVVNKQGNPRVLAEMQLNDPKTFTIASLATLLKIVSQHAPQYHITRNQCYWFAYMIWKIMVPQASRISHLKHWDLRGTYEGRSVLTDATGASVSTIRAEFDAAMHEAKEQARQMAQARQADAEKVHAFLQ